MHCLNITPTLSLRHIYCILQSVPFIFSTRITRNFQHPRLSFQLLKKYKTHKCKSCTPLPSSLMQKIKYVDFLKKHLHFKAFTSNHGWSLQAKACQSYKVIKDTNCHGGVAITTKANSACACFTSFSVHRVNVLRN